jgi:hypothetical protein
MHRLESETVCFLVVCCKTYALVNLLGFNLKDSLILDFDKCIVTSPIPPELKKEDENELSNITTQVSSRNSSG